MIMVETINQDKKEVRPKEPITNSQLRQMLHGIAEHKMHLVEQSGIRDQFAEAISVSNRELESTQNDLRHLDPDEPKYGLPDDVKVDHYFNTVAQNLGVEPALMTDILDYIAIDEAEQTASDNNQELSIHISQGLPLESYVPYISRHNLDVFADGYANIYGEQYDAAEALRQENDQPNTYDAPTIQSESFIPDLNNVNLGLSSESHIALSNISTDTTYMNQELPELSAEANNALEDFSHAYAMSNADLTDEEELVNDALLVESMGRMVQNKQEIQKQLEKENIIVDIEILAELDGLEATELNNEFLKVQDELWQGLENRNLTQIDKAYELIENYDSKLSSFRMIADSEYPDALRDIKPLIIVEEENAFDSIVPSANAKNLVNKAMVDLLDGIKEGRSPKNEELGDAFNRQVDIMAEGWGITSGDLMDDPNLFQDWMAQTIEQTVEDSTYSDVQHIESQKVEPFIVIGKVFDKEDPTPDMKKFMDGYKKEYFAPIDAVNLTMTEVYDAVGNDTRTLEGVQGLLNYKDVMMAESPSDLAVLTKAVEERIKNEQKPKLTNSSYTAPEDDGPEM